MRLTLLGKFAILALTVAVLSAVWFFLPRSVRRQARREQPAVAQTREEKPPEVLVLGYVGTPPLFVVDLTSRQPVLAKAPDGVKDRWALAPETNPARLLEKVARSGRDAAVVDFPTVVYASMKRMTGYRVVMLVSWREGADAVVGAADWTHARHLVYIPASSSEYVVRSLLQESRLSPADAETAAGRLKAVDSLDGAMPGHGAAFGRLDQMGHLEYPTTSKSVTRGVVKTNRMPDVLIVSDAFARREPDAVTDLVRRFLEGARRLPKEASGSEFLKGQGARIGLDTADLLEQMKPASEEDSRDFMGIGTDRPGYAALVSTQVRRTGTGGPTPIEDVNPPVDNEPLRRVLSEANNR